MRTRAETITSLTLSSGTVEIDEAGYLIDPATWTPEFCAFVAEKEGIEINDLHHQSVEFMRVYLTEHGVAPDVRHVTGFLGELLSLDKRAAKAKFYELFPAGHVSQACKMAGMRQPRAWSTG